MFYVSVGAVVVCQCFMSVLKLWLFVHVMQSCLQESEMTKRKFESQAVTLQCRLMEVERRLMKAVPIEVTLIILFSASEFSSLFDCLRKRRTTNKVINFWNSKAGFMCRR